MIFREDLDITCEADYQKITEHIKERDQYVDENLIAQISRHIGLVCQGVTVEYPYYENDFLSSYYIFYAKNYKNFQKSAIASCFMQIESTER